MESFQYRARDKKGQLILGEIKARDLKAAKALVANQGLVPVDVSVASQYSPKRLLKRLSGHFKGQISLEEKLAFNRQLEIVFSVGIPIIHGLNMIQAQTAHPVLKQAVGQIAIDLADGSSLFEAMSRHPRIFDSVYLNLIRVGEATGELEMLLGRASEMTEQQAEQREKIKSAMFYPKIVLGFMSITFLGVIYGILPRLKTFFTGMGAELPPLTKLVMGTSDFFVSYWFVVVGIVVGGFMGFKRLTSTPNGLYFYHRTLLRLPVFGALFIQIEMNTFCIMLELLLKSGVNITEAFKLVSRSVTNSVVSRDIDDCGKHIEKGGTVSAGFKKSEVFPPFVTNLISVGEEGGKLPSVLSRISAYYKIQVDHRLNNLSKLIEPILLFLIFGIVMILALAVFLPMWKMSSAIKK